MRETEVDFIEINRVCCRQTNSNQANSNQTGHNLTEKIKAVIQYKIELKSKEERKRSELAGKIIKHKKHLRIRLLNKFQSDLRAELKIKSDELAEKFQRCSMLLEEDAINFSFYLASIIIETELSQNSKIVYKKLKKLSELKIAKSDCKVVSEVESKSRLEADSSKTILEFTDELGTVRYSFIRELEAILQMAVAE